MLGERKLTALFKARPALFNMDVKHTRQQLTTQLQDVPGFKDKSAAPIIANLAECFRWLQTLPLTYKKAAVVKVVGSKLKGESVCFTGVRDKAAEDAIVAQGGKVASGVSGTTTILVMKEKGSGSSKELKAQDMGIPIYTLAEFKKKYGV